MFFSIGDYGVVLHEENGIIFVVLGSKFIYFYNAQN